MKNKPENYSSTEEYRNITCLSNMNKERKSIKRISNIKQIKQLKQQVKRLKHTIEGLTLEIIPSLQEENHTIRTLHQSMIKHHHNKIKPETRDVIINLIGGQVVSIQGLTADHLVFVNELTENKKITLKNYQQGLGKEIK